MYVAVMRRVKRVRTRVSVGRKGDGMVSLCNVCERPEWKVAQRE